MWDWLQWKPKRFALSHTIVFDAFTAKHDKCLKCDRERQYHSNLDHKFMEALK